MERGCLGIDIGGTSVKLGLFDHKGILLERWNLSTKIGENGTAMIHDIILSVKEKLCQFGIPISQLAGMGIGVPGQVSEDGQVILAENIGWKHVPLGKILEEELNVNVKTENDVNLAALGEVWKGSARSCKSMLFVALGTGVGCGIVEKGKILSGANGAAGEIGHMHVEDHMQKQCVCGKYGCLEQLASGTGLRWLGKRILESSLEPSLLRNEEISAKTIFEAVQKQDSLAIQIAEKFGNYLGKALANCTCLLDPEMIVIGGGVSKAGPVVLDYIKKYYSQYAYQPAGAAEFRLASLGSDAGIYGAAFLALESESGTDPII